MIKVWGVEVDRTGGEADELWKKGLEVAEGMVDFTQEERLENLFPSEEEEEEEEEGSENDESDDEKTEQNTNSSPKKRKTEQKTNSPPKKRRKIDVAEDSGSESEEETFEVEIILDIKKEGGITRKTTLGSHSTILTVRTKLSCLRTRQKQNAKF